MKQILATTSLIALLLALMMTSFAYAEEDPAMVWVVEMAKEYAPNRDKFFDAYMDVTGITNPKSFQVVFDWRDGNESIDIMSCYNARVYTLYPATTLEKIHCLLAFLNKFEEIEGRLPQNVELIYKIIEADGNKLFISDENYQMYRLRFQEAIGILEN